jgi:hypothetical protein
MPIRFQGSVVQLVIQQLEENDRADLLAWVRERNRPAPRRLKTKRVPAQAGLVSSSDFLP